MGAATHAAKMGKSDDEIMTLVDGNRIPIKDI
jgi:hypothetical protein